MISLFVAGFSVSYHEETPRQESGRLLTNVGYLHALTVIPSSALRVASGLFASLSWVNMVFSYSDALSIGAESSESFGGIRDAAHFDPLWEMPVQFATLALSRCPNDLRYVEYRNFVDSGLARFPNVWRTRLFYAVQLRNCGVPLDSLRSIVYPLNNCKDCPGWVRAFPASFLESTISTSMRAGILCEAWRLAPDPIERKRIKDRVIKMIVNSRRGDGVDFKVIVEALFHLMSEKDSTASASAQAVIESLAQDSISIDQRKLLGIVAASLGKPYR